MKKLKYLIIALVLVSGFTSCMVAYDRPGYYHHPHPRPHHYHHHGYYR
ncbi:MAG TPA: hypothetical protein VFS25_08455 [Chitinophaga sp.]|nr:hypothetical protein [Chitinophaga sp.]HEU4552851.1 hypothetical protein [Chitinophaga sp.]